MSRFDTAPPNTRPGGNDDALRTKGDDSMVSPANQKEQGECFIDREAYERDVPLWKRTWQHSLTQMILLSIQAFCGPAMADDIAGLGGGGLATPQTSNIATAINYTMLATVCMFGGRLVNKIGTNVPEAGSIMSLAPSGARGNLSKNRVKGAVGGVTPDTCVAFLIIECMALPFAFLVSPVEKVVRSDGTKIVMSEKSSTRPEFKKIKFTLTSKLILLSELWAVWSFFYSGARSTYLGVYFAVRIRALSSLISPFFCIIGCFGLGFILDMKNVSQRRRAQYGLYTVVILNTGVYIWSIIMQTRFDANNPGKIDWDESLYAKSFLPYFFVQTTGPLSQSYMYWLLSSFATDAQSNLRNGAAFRSLEAVRQAIAYGMNTRIRTSPLIGFCVTFGLMAAALGRVIVLVNSTPDRTPADIVAEELEAARHQTEEFPEKEKAMGSQIREV